MPTYSIQGPDGKTYSIEGPEGATREQVIYAVQARMSAPPPVPQTERTWGEAAKDVGASLAGGLGGLLQFPGQLVQLAPGLNGLGQALQTPGKAISEFGEDLKSEGLKAREALRNQAMTEAEKDGVLSQFAVAIKETVKDPALLSSFVAEQLPLLLGPLGAAKVTQKLGMAGVEAAGKGLTGTAAKEATEEAAKALGKRATAAAYVTGSAMQAGDVSGDTYDEIYKRAIEAGQTPEQAQATAVAGARKAAAGAFGASLLAQRLPGAQAIEKRLAGVPAGGRVGAAIGEAGGEALEEGAGQFFKNVGLREITPDQALLEGVGGAAGLGALGGGLMGGALGGGKQPQQESLYETAQRLNQEIRSIDEQLRPAMEATEQDVARKQFGLMTNSELVDMYREQGYGAVKQYQMQLVEQAKAEDLPTEERKQAITLAQDIQSFLTQTTKEQVERLQRQTQVIDKEILSGLEIDKNSPAYAVLLNRDIAKPEEASLVVSGLENLLKSGTLEGDQADYVANALTSIQQYLSSVPGGEYASTDFDPSTGEGVRLADERGAGTAGGAKPTQPDGLGSPEVPAERPVGGEGSQPAPVEAVQEPVQEPVQEAVQELVQEPVQEPTYEVMEVSREESPTGKRGYSVFKDGEPGPYFPSKELAERWIRGDKQGVKTKPVIQPTPSGKEVEFKQPKAPLPPEIQSAEDEAVAAEAAVRKTVRASESLWTALRGKLSKEEVSDIGPGLRFRPLVNSKNPNFGSISTLVADGALDAFLPPNKRLGMAEYDEYDNTEYIKELVRRGDDALLSYDTRAEVDRIFGSVAEAERLIKDYLNEADINAEIRAAEAELRQTAERGTSKDIDEATLTKRPTGTAPEPSGKAEPPVKPKESQPAYSVQETQVEPEPGKAKRAWNVVGGDGYVFDTFNTKREAQDWIKNAKKDQPKKSVRPEEERAGEILKGIQTADEETDEDTDVETQERPEVDRQALIEKRKELVSDLDYTLKKILAKYGLKDVKLDLEDAMEAEGSYAREVIKLALNLDNPIRVLKHESIHALKDMGFFSPAQWKVLEKRAEEDWVNALKETPHSDTQSRYDAYVELFTQEARDKGVADVEAYVEEAIIEEAIADAFGAYDATKAPPGLMAAILERMRKLFRAIKEAFGAQGIESAEDIFGKIEEGKLKAAPKIAEETNKSGKEEEDQAKAYLRENGIMPYTSAGPIGVDLSPPKYSLQKFNPDKHLKFDPTLGVPINKDGTVTVYYHTTKERAKDINNSKIIKTDGRARVYVTNESSGAEALRNPGSFDQEFDDSTVLLYVTPEMLQVETNYENGRVDFFIPVTEGAYYSKKMKWHSVQKARTSAITDQFSYSSHAARIKSAIDLYKASDSARRKVLLKQARQILKREHNIGSLLSENGKLEKTRIGEYDLDYDGLPVASMGLGLASAQKISDKVSTCPRSAICEGLCLGETSGGNFMFGGAAAEDVGEISKSAFRAAARMMQYLKTEALIVNPEAFSILLQAEIENLSKWSEKPTQRVKIGGKIDGKMQTVPKDIYRPAVRLNVTSDFKPEMFESVIRANPGVMFYDYTKINSDKIADNHHLTYSSEGFGQVVDGKKIFFKDKAGNYAHNWSQVRARLNEGSNVAMAFTNKRGDLPKFLEDEETGARYRVLDGDLYDARFLDEFSPEKRDSNGLGVIVGLRNKAGNIAEKIAAEKTEGFFVNYKPEMDDTVKVPDQSQFKQKKIPIRQEKLSLRANTEAFKRWFGDSKVVDENGNPLVVYHGTTGDFGTFDRIDGGNAYGPGYYFTADPAEASGYAEGTGGGRIRPKGDGAPNVMPVYLSAKSVFALDNRVLSKKEIEKLEAASNQLKPGSWKTGELTQAFDRAYPPTAQNVMQYITEQAGGSYTELAKAAGFDGLKGSYGYVVFNPNQIKSAIGNTGEFDPANPDIRYSLRSPQSLEFKQFLSGSKAVDESGDAIPYYHATLRDIKIFNPGGADAIFLSPDPDFSNAYFAQKLREAARKPGDYLSPPEIRAAVRKLREYVYENYGRQSKASKDMLLSITEAEDIGKKTGVYKFPGELTDAWEGSLYEIGALESSLPVGRSIMPLYVSVKDPFNFEDKKQVDRLLKQLAKSDAVDKKMTQMGKFTQWPAPTQTAEEQEKIVKDYYRENILDGDWRTIESEEVQEAIRALKHDGFYINEAGEYGDIVKNLAVYSSKQVKSALTNAGSYGQRPVTSQEAERYGMTEEEAAEAQEKGDIRLSLRKATWTDSRIEFLLEDNYYLKNGRERDTKGYAAFINPEDFLNATTPPSYRETLEGENRPLSRSKLERQSQPILLEIRPQTKVGEYAIVGHQGRHRMMALRDVGITQVPVLLQLSEGRHEPNAKSLDGVYLKPQVFDGESSPSGISNVSMTPLSWDAREEVKQKFGGEAEVKFSLRRSVAAAMTPNVRRTVDKIAPPTYEPNLWERIVNTISGDTHTYIRSQLVNRYERLAEYDRRVAKMIKQAGGVQQLADQKAESAALFSDLTAGLLETAMGAVDKFGGAPVFKNGVTTISNFNKSVKGPILIFKPISDLNSPDAFRLYQAWTAVKRGKRLMAEGREQAITAQEIADIQAMERANPNLTKLFEAVQKDWIRYNNKLVKFAQDTGVLSPEMAKEYTAHGDYFPFYRLVDEDIAGPKMFTSIGNVRQPKKLKGSEAPLGDFFENIVRNSQAMIQAGIKNVAAQKAANQALLLKEAVRLPKKESGVNVFRVFENGQEVYYKSSDPLFIDAIKSMNMGEMPLMGILSGPANLLRNLVTKDPAFMLANMMRDSLSAYVTTGVKMTPIVDTLKNFTTAISGRSPEMQKLYAAGVLGGHDYAQGAKTSAADFKQRLRELSGQKTTVERLTSPFTSVWAALEKGTQASDAATRIEIYKKTLAETGNEAEAYWAALEVMNFNRRGKSPVIRILTAAIPFLNARLQGLDVLYRTAIYPLISGSATDQEKARMKTFFVRGMTMMALSAMYWMMVHDDDDYKKQEQETKDNYWLIPGAGVKIPIPFEVGVMFKVIPERIMALTFGDDTARDFTQSMARQISGTFGFNIIPQAALPIYEAKTNFSFFTQRAILGQGLEGVAPEYQVGPGTSRAAEVIAGAFSWLPTGFIGAEIVKSPALIDHLIKGYTGTMGQYASDLFNVIYDMGSESPKASKRFEQMPVIRRFLLDPEARGNVTAYYELKNAVDESVRTSNFLERSMNFEEYGRYYEDNVNVLATADYIKSIESSMKDLRQMKQMVLNAPMSADDKRDTVTAIGQMESDITANIQELKKLANR